MQVPSFSDIESAHERIKPFIHKTPVHTSTSLNSLQGAEFFFKCENFQKVGAFKFRGATNAVEQLSETETARGVATHSSGNHAAALALAARNRGIKAYVVMPETSPSIKIKAVKGYGAEVIFCKSTLEARESTLKDVVKKTCAIEIHPYNNFNVIAGQGTAAKELAEEVDGLDIVMCPVGGGGLLSGTSIAIKAMLPGAKVIACEPAGADDAYRSFYGGKLVPSVNPQTKADGLLTSLGTLNYAIIKAKTDRIVTVSEGAIIEAMRMIWERMKIIVEPSAAVPFAAVVEKKIDVKNKRIGIILSGGNIDLEKLPF